jgi:hypothetical protein
MQDTIPDYQLPITRPRSATSFKQKQTMIRPTSASAIVRNIITSPIKAQNPNETKSRIRGQSAPSSRQSNTKIQEETEETEKNSLNITNDKSPGKKESMRRLVKTVGRQYGLPSDVFEGPYYKEDTLKDLFVLGDTKNIEHLTGILIIDDVYKTVATARRVLDIINSVAPEVPKYFLSVSFTVLNEVIPGGKV